LIADFNDYQRLPAVLRNFARKYRAVGKYDQAESIYETIAAGFPDTNDALRAQLDASMINILSFIDDGNDTAAMAAIDKLIADFNDHSSLPGAVFVLGEQYFYGEDYQKAIDIWKIVLNKYPGRGPKLIPYLLATCYERLEDYPTAIRYYKQVVEEYPDCKYAHRAPYRLGLLQRGQKQYDEAIYWFTQQPKLYSDTLHAERAMHSLGAIYMRDLEDYEAAAGIFESYLRQYPEGHYAKMARYGLAVCREKLAPSTDATKRRKEAMDQLYSDVTTLPIEENSPLQKGGKE